MFIKCTALISPQGKKVDIGVNLIERPVYINFALQVSAFEEYGIKTDLLFQKGGRLMITLNTGINILIKEDLDYLLKKLDKAGLKVYS